MYGSLIVVKLYTQCVHVFQLVCSFLKLSEENQREKQRAQQLDIEVTRLRQEVTRKEQEKRALRTFDAVAINNICKLIVVGIMQGVEGVSTRISHDERITNERSRKAEFIIWVKSKKF